MSTHIHLGSLWQLVGAVLALANLWGLALVLAAFSLFQALGEQTAVEAASMSMAAAAFFLTGGLCIPSAYYALCRLFGWRAIDIRFRPNRFQLALLLLAFPITLALGYLVARFDTLSWLILPALHILAVGLPVSWVLYLAIRGLPLGSSQRYWGVFDSGLVLGPVLILAFELALALAFLLIAAVVVASSPELIAQLQAYAEQFSTQTLNQEEALNILGPVLQQPAVMLAVLGYAAVAVPVIEEFIKPVGAWLLFGRRLTPAEGFAAGALSGAGYALFESLMLSGSGETWMWIVLGRTGTAVLHIATSSLVGWALVQARNPARILRLGLVYLGAVLAHGFWNAAVILNAYLLLSSEQTTSTIPMNMGGGAGQATLAVLVSMTFLMMAILIWANRKLSSSGGTTNLASVAAGASSNSSGRANDL